VVVLVVLLIGCSPVGSAPQAPPTVMSVAQTLTPSPFINQQAASDRALQIASLSRPELSGAQVPPTHVQAAQMTLAAAVKQLTGRDDVAAGYDPSMMVWVVTMEGIWTDEFSRPTALPSPEPYRHYTVILNARTGEEIEAAARP
jgi:hypothetical protein